ncbi:glycosyltransferase family 4 protein [Candidatus Woesearchaeota archaeon]|nr:glycosyltransferase family 4 protein [Candidatus Woesearchaeota archaeon]
MRVGMISSYPPLKDSVARIYTYNLVKNCKTNFVKIGSSGSRADYVINFKSFSLRRRIQEIIKKENLDILHIQYIAPLYGKFTFNLNLLPVYSLGIPVVTTLHEVQFKMDGSIITNLRHAVLEFIEGNIVRKSSRLIVHTDVQKRFLVQKYKADNVEVVHTGLYPRKNIPKKSRSILFFGIISKGKGLEHLIEAMELLSDFRLTIAGSTPNSKSKQYLERLKDKVSKSRAKGRIDIVSGEWISDKVKDKLYRQTSIVVIPYTWGPYNSGIVQDAAEYNIPVVITKVGAIFDVVKEYRTGEIIKPESPEQIAKGINAVYLNLASYREGIEKYRKMADWKQNGKNHIKIYESIKPTS